MRKLWPFLLLGKSLECSPLYFAKVGWFTWEFDLLGRDREPGGGESLPVDLRGKYYTGKILYGENILRGRYYTGKILYGENIIRGKYYTGTILYGENIIRGKYHTGKMSKVQIKTWLIGSFAIRQPWLCCNSHQRGPRVSSARFFLPSHQFIIIIIRNRPCRHRTDSASDDKLLLFASEHYWLNPDWHWQRQKENTNWEK